MTEKRFTTFVENGSVCLNDALKVYKVVDVYYYEYLLDCMNELNNENEQLKRQNKHLSNIIECLEIGSCRSIDSFIDSYCTDELLNKYGLNEDDLFYGDCE